MQHKLVHLHITNKNSSSRKVPDTGWPDGHEGRITADELSTTHTSIVHEDDSINEINEQEGCTLGRTGFSAANQAHKALF